MTAVPREALRVVIVDDEVAARRRMIRLLGELPDVVLLASCGSGREALDAIAVHRPDVVFLDIRMPGLDGLAVANRTRASAPPGAEPPLVVFVTAYDEHALEAFQVHAADYVLKPVDPQRLREAVEHARRTVDRARLARAAADGASPGAGAARPTAPRFVTRDGRSSRHLPVHEIVWVESYGNYTRLHTAAGGRFLHRGTMAEVLAALTPHGFARIHREAIVNAHHVARIRPAGSGQYEVLLASGTPLRSSRTYRASLDTLRARVPR